MARSVIKAPAKASAAAGAAPVGSELFINRVRAKQGIEVREREVVRRFVTESVAINRMCGVGGLPLGRIVVGHGPYRAGKSTSAAAVLGDVGRAGGIGYYADVERAVVKAWFRFCGLPDNNYIYRMPRTQEDAQDKILEFLRMAREARTSGEITESAPIVVVIDTISKMVPEDMLSGKIGSRNFGLQANLFNDWTKAAIVLAEEADACLWLVSQERRDREVREFPNMPDWMRYKPTTGDDVSYSATLQFRFDVRSQVKEGADEAAVKVGKKHEVRVIKSKLGPDGGCAFWYTSNGKGSVPLGLDRVRELVDMALDMELLHKPPKSARIEATWDGSLAWNGERRLRDVLVEDEDVRADLFARVQARIDEEARGNGHEV